MKLVGSVIGTIRNCTFKTESANNSNANLLTITDPTPVGKVRRTLLCKYQVYSRLRRFNNTHYLQATICFLFRCVKEWKLLTRKILRLVPKISLSPVDRVYVFSFVDVRVFVFYFWEMFSLWLWCFVQDQVCVGV